MCAWQGENEVSQLISSVPSVPFKLTVLDTHLTGIFINIITYSFLQVHVTLCHSKKTDLWHNKTER